MSEHTPGTWQYSLHEKFHTNDVYVKMDKENRATVEGPDAEANARIITAAPRMLAHLESIAAIAGEAAAKGSVLTLGCVVAVSVLALSAVAARGEGDDR